MAAFTVSALSPVLIPFALDKNGNLNGAGYAAGVMFWVGIIAGIVGYVLIYNQYKKICPEEKGKKISLRFFSNRPAQVMDGILIAGIVGTIYCMVNVTVNQIVAVVFLLLTLIGLYSHFLLNGAVYQYIWNNKSENKTVQLKKGED